MKVRALSSPALVIVTLFPLEKVADPPLVDAPPKVRLPEPERVVLTDKPSESQEVPPALTSPQVTTEPSVLTAAKAAVFV